MLEETPPNDGHRKTILDPYHTHVGFGIALQGHSLRLDELYLARYVRLDPITRQAKPKSTVVLTGNLLNAKHFLNQVDVFYEPLPTPPDLAWLRTPRPVSLPDTYKPCAPGLCRERPTRMVATEILIGGTMAGFACPQNFSKMNRASTRSSSGSGVCRPTRVFRELRFASSVNEMRFIPNHPGGNHPFSTARWFWICFA